ncbi:MAG: hypothetical protein VKN60_07130 [Cyanobacteriota bacterium]|nr:hypothetical protein [Cyanobacteriota bacterium]
MTYTFDILGVAPVFTFFNYQQDVEQRPERSLAYVASYDCTLDSLIKSTELILRRPDWDWDAVAQTMVNFWLRNPEPIQRWKQELDSLGKDNLLVGRVANVESLRQAFESLL